MPDDNNNPGGMPNTEPPGGVLPAGGQPSAADLLAELKRAREALKAANREAADRRKKLDAYETAEEERKQAAMTELEKLTKAKTDAEERASKVMQEANTRVLKAAFIAEAAKHGAKVPADAYALAQADGAQVSVDDSGNPVGVAEAVKALVDAGRLVLSGRPSAPGLDGGAGGGNRPAPTIQLTDAQKYLAYVSGMTEEQYIVELKRGQESEKIRSQPDMG